jgi:hypothetical protein
MAERLTKLAVAEKAAIHAELPEARQSHMVDRTFEIPTVVYAAMAGLFLTYLALMGVGFAAPDLALPLAICVLSVFAGFFVPSLWSRMGPDKQSRAKSWGRFVSEGIQTDSGPVSAGSAVMQVLILPVLIFAWGLIAVTIAAFI